MKKLCLSILCIIFLLIYSCNNATDSQEYENTITISIKKSEIYNYKTGIIGDEDGASIIVQAKYYEISDIVRNVDTNWEAVYKYKPRTGFVGTDYVELKLSTGSDGVNPPTNVEIIKIKIVVH